MTQFKRRTNIFSHVISSLCSLLQKIPNPPHCSDWEDFWDFTRMKVPKSINILARLRLGSSRFLGNYIFIYVFLIFFLGMCVNHYFLIPLAVLVGTWIIICMVTEVDDFYKDRKVKEYIISLKNRVSAIMLFIVRER